MNKILILIAVFFTFNFQLNAQGVAINTTSAAADASAALDVQSTTQGMLVPRMNASQRGMIATPATGLLVYQTDGTAGFYFYNGTAWTSLSGGGSGDNLGNHTATQALNMGNFNITNVNNIKPKELFYDLPTTTTYTYTNSADVTSANLDATGRTWIRVNAPSCTFHGMAGGVHGKVVTIIGTPSTTTFSFNSTTETTASNRFSNAWIPITGFTAPWFVTFMYDSTESGGTGRWMLIDSRQ